jgi:hypothetical protein
MYLANSQKIIPLFGNWTFCQMSPENWQNVARKFSGDIWQIAKCRQKIGKLSPENFLATFGYWPKKVQNVREKGDKLDLLPNVARKLAKCRQKIFWRHLANSQKIIPFFLAICQIKGKHNIVSLLG